MLMLLPEVLGVWLWVISSSSFPWASLHHYVSEGGGRGKEGGGEGRGGMEKYMEGRREKGGGREKRGKEGRRETQSR